MQKRTRLLERNGYSAQYTNKRPKPQRRRKTQHVLTWWDVLFASGILCFVIAGILLGVFGPVV